MNKNYRLTVQFDQDADNPLDHSAFSIASFNNRHGNFKHPDIFTEIDCPTCDGYGIIDGDYNKDCPKCETSGAVECNLADNPEVLATLSYYEHGLCQWMVGSSRVSDPGGWDTAQTAGVIVWSEYAEDSDKEWFNSLDDEGKAKCLDGIAEEYTSYCNGDVFGFTFVELETCPTCGDVAEAENGEIDSCWGFIGSDYFQQHIRDEVVYGLEPSSIEIVGEASEYINV